MKNLIKIFCLVVLLLTHVSLSVAAVPNEKEQNLQNNLLPETNIAEPTISRRQASDLARQRYDGRVLSIRKDRDTWRVRMDEEGTVFNVFVNSSTGTVSRSSN